MTHHLHSPGLPQSVPPPRKRRRGAQTPGPNAGKIDARASSSHLWLLPVLVLATLAAYYPAWHGGLLWDDAQHMTSPSLQSGEGLRRIWFDLRATQQYYPITHSAFWLQYRFWADATLGYHIVNILLHALSAFLVAVILRRLAVPGAMLAALVFALHPVHVESVAWITELKNTLSGVFFLASAVAYLRFDERREARFYASALTLFVLALLAKTVTAMLPLALLVVAWWRHGRIDRRRDVWPLVPFLALGAADGLLTAWLERTIIGAQGAEFAFSFVERCLIAGRAIWFYLGTLLWPSNLVFNYPRWEVSQAVWWQYLFPLAVIAVVWASGMARQRTRAPLAAMLTFSVLLFPALGFFNVYPFRFSFVADHFAYLASVPIIAFASAVLASAARRWELPTAAATAGALTIAGVLGVLTFRQSRHYVDAETLYLHVLERNPSSWLAHGNLGTLQVGTRPDEALVHLNEAIRLSPDVAETHNDRGTVLQRMGRLEEAVADYREAVRLGPTFATAHSNLANALLESGRPEEAIVAGRDALRLQPDFVEAHFTVALALTMLGRPEAVDQFNAVLALRPDFPEAHNYLGTVLQSMGRHDEALKHFSDAVRLRPDYADAHLNLGGALEALGRHGEAATHYREALRLDPESQQARDGLARVSGQ